MRFWVVARLELTVRRVCRAVMAEVLVNKLDIGLCPFNVKFCFGDIPGSHRYDRAASCLWVACSRVHPTWRQFVC